MGSERLGHRAIQMTLDAYGHLLPGQDADAAARFERLLWAVWRTGRCDPQTATSSVSSRPVEQ